MIARTSTNESSTASMRHICRVLFRHQRKMIVFFCTTFVVLAAGLMLYPRTYVSEARLFVRLGKESVSLDPTATLGRTVSVDGSRETEINSELEILRSRSLLQDIVDRLGPQSIVSSSTNEKDGWLATVLSPLRTVKSWVRGDIGPAERAIIQLEKAITVTSPRKSNVIVLTCRARSPQQAQQILQVFVDSFIVRHVKANRTAGSYEFFVDQSELIRQQLKQASTELRDAKNKTGLVSIVGHQLNLQTQANAIEVAMLENQRLFLASEAKIAQLKKALDEIPSQFTAEETAGLPNVAADTMRNELYKLQIYERELSSRFTSEHPSVIAARVQLADTQKIFDQQEAQRSQTTRKLNPMHQSLQTELTAAQALAASQKVQVQSLDQQYAAVQSRIRNLNDSESHIAELTRRVELLEVNYRSYTNNLEQARIDRALETDRISNVNVVQPASFAATPASPSVQLALILGLTVSTLGALLVAFGAEYFDRSLKTPEQIERELGLPVLLAVSFGARHELFRN